jgi:hypothetical protein
MSRRLAVAGLAPVLLFAGVACSAVDNVGAYREMAADVKAAEGHRVWSILPEPDAVYRVVVEGEGRSVELLQSAGGLWQAGAGSDPVTASLMEESEDHLLPLPAYRRLDVDASDPQFGFTAVGITVTTESRTAQRTRVRIGGSNPTGGGFYAQRDGDGHVYVVVREAVDDLRSVLGGARVAPASDPQLDQVLQADAASEDPEEVTNPWLGQVLAAEASP